MKVLLVNPPWSEVYGRYKPAARVGVMNPPLGLCYLSSVAKDAGFNVDILDAEVEVMNEEQVANYAIKKKYDAVGITATTPLFHKANKIAELIKKKNKSIVTIIGGPHVTLMPHLIKNSYFDYGIVGEGEITFPELLKSIKKRVKNPRTRGIVYRENKKIIKTKPRELIKNLDSLPFPDRESLNLDKYKWSVPKKGIMRFTTILGSRGCPFKCIFCSTNAIFGRKFRLRSAENIFDELKQLVDEFNIRHFLMIDDTLTVSRKRMMELSRLIVRNKLDITWEGWTRANLVDKVLLRTMKRAGFNSISFGIESGDPKILKVIKKGVDLKSVDKAYKIAKSLGIETRCSVMIGHPFETRESAMRTLNFIKNLKYCDQARINISTPYPGTKLYDMALKGEGGIKLYTKEFSKYRRYGNAVISVNDLSREDLIKMQKKGIRMFYLSSPRRIWYNLRRAGLKAAINNSIAFAKSFF